jgi:phosphatidylserine decarboxylase
VATIIYNPGRFFSANLDKASLENEQNSLFVDGARGRLVLNQIAGLVARRIVCRVSEGAELTKGERIGIIRFGSRVDVYMPIDSRVTVKVGDRVKAGSSVLGYW